jgi:hypothetical protein
MQSLRQQPTVLKEPPRTRPDLDTLACVPPACQRFRRPGGANLTVPKVSGHDRMRRLRWRTGGEACSDRRGSALCNTKLPEATAEAVIHQLGEGWSVRATARLVQVAKETGARLLRVTGRHATRCHDQPVHGLTPRALACDAQWSFGKKWSRTYPLRINILNLSRALCEVCIRGS